MAIERYELRRAGVKKFWEAERVGTTQLRTRAGDIGNAGQEATRRFETERERDVALSNAKRKRRKEGYAPAPLVPAAPRVAKKPAAAAAPAAKPAKRAKPPAVIATNPELEARIEAAPDDPAGYLVYADWLTAHGDPRGELIAVQHAAEAAKTPRERALLREREVAILREHGRLVFGDVPVSDEDLGAVWRRGFVREARVAMPHWVEGVDGLALLDRLLALPAARFLASLRVGLVAYEERDGANGGFDRAVARLAKGPTPRTLRALFVGDFEFPDESELSWVHLGDVSPLYAGMPWLESLTLQGGTMTLGKIVLPELRSFEVRTTGLSPKNVASILKARWPKLERLQLWLGSADRGGPPDADAYAPLVRAKFPSSLTHLGLVNAEHTDAACELLPTAPVAPQLRSLDLSMGTLSDEGARALVKHKKSFPNLERLDVTGSHLTKPAQKSLAKAFPNTVFGYQNPRPGSGRYISVWE